MNTLTLYWFFLVSVIIPMFEGASQIAGPFDVIVKRAGNCPNVEIPKNGISFESKIIRHTRKYSTLEANVTLGVPGTDDIKGVVTLSRMSNQGWKDNFLTVDVGGACKAAKKYIPGMFKDVVRSFNRTDCPIPPGFYTNIIIDLNITVGIDTMIYNDYKGRAIGRVKGELIFCAEFLVSVVPKKPGRKN